ncbi:MAG: PilN domain-containing protein, partial [Pseudomonadales bacterium]
IQGYAESASRISEQLRNLEESPWFDEPNVSAIVADELKGGQASSFDLSLQALGTVTVEESSRGENRAAGNSLENNVAEVQP